MTERRIRSVRPPNPFLGKGSSAHFLGSITPEQFQKRAKKEKRFARLTGENPQTRTERLGSEVLSAYAQREKRALTPSEKHEFESFFRRNIHSSHLSESEKRVILSNIAKFAPEKVEDFRVPFLALSERPRVQKEMDWVSATFRRFGFIMLCQDNLRQAGFKVSIERIEETMNEYMAKLGDSDRVSSYAIVQKLKSQLSHERKKMKTEQTKRAIVIRARMASLVVRSAELAIWRFPLSRKERREILKQIALSKTESPIESKKMAIALSYSSARKQIVRELQEIGLKESILQEYGADKTDRGIKRFRMVAAILRQSRRRPAQERADILHRLIERGKSPRRPHLDISSTPIPTEIPKKERVIRPEEKKHPSLKENIPRKEAKPLTPPRPFREWSLSRMLKRFDAIEHSRRIQPISGEILSGIQNRLAADIVRNGLSGIGQARLRKAIRAICLIEFASNVPGTARLINVYRNIKVPAEARTIVDEVLKELDRQGYITLTRTNIITNKKRLVKYDFKRV